MERPPSLFRQARSVVLGYNLMNLLGTPRIPVFQESPVALNHNGFDLSSLQP
jgi:hypothetical protein